MNPKFKFLIDQGTSKVKHGGDRSLFNHLTATYSMLQGWQAETIVQDAGLYHSIYGTEYFKPKTLTLEDRPLVRELIGDEAEHLVYLFCTTLNRFNSFQAMQEPDRSRLMQISYANEKEMHHTSVLLADGWDDPSYHPYLTSRMIPEGPRLDFYKGKI